MEKISGRIFVGGLCRETSEATLMEYFSNYGKIDDCFIVIDTTTGCSKGYGFVNFTDSAMADRALAQPDHYILGRKVDVKHATERGERNQGKEHDVLKKIFVGGLPHGLTISQLRGYFERFGPVEDAVIMCDVKGNPRGFGFVTFSSVSDAGTVLQRRFHVLDDKPVEVKKAEPVGVNRAELKDKTVSGRYEVCNTCTTELPSSSSSFGPCFGLYPNRNGCAQASLPPHGSAQAPLPPYGSAQAPPPFYGSAQAPSPFYGYAQAPSPFYGYAQAPLPPHGSAQAPSPFYVSAQPPLPPYGSAHAPSPFYGYAQAPLPPHGSAQATPPFCVSAQPPLPPYGSAQAPSPFYSPAQASSPFYGYAQAPLYPYAYMQTGNRVLKNGMEDFSAQTIPTETGDHDFDGNGTYIVPDSDGNEVTNFSTENASPGGNAVPATVMEAENVIETGDDVTVPATIVEAENLIETGDDVTVPAKIVETENLIETGDDVTVPAKIVETENLIETGDDVTVPATIVEAENMIETGDDVTVPATIVEAEYLIKTGDDVTVPATIVEAEYLIENGDDVTVPATIVEAETCDD